MTAGFLAVALVLGAIVYGLDRFNIGPTPSANATATAAAGESLQLFSFEESRVTTLELRQGDRSTRVEKKDDGWVIADTGEPANRASFNSLLARLSQLRATRRVEAAGALAQYGLEPPRLVVRAELNDGTSQELLIGSKTPVQTGTFAKKADAPEVAVIADQFVSDAERLLGDPKEPPTPTPRPATPTPETTPTPGP
ncbi:MAG: DUF4340 domain-containing protein [Chloroflexota bacterium]|nr:DUF4340 domain-containing protein [Chloroflexota bacterium]